MSIPRELHQFCSLSCNRASNLSFFPSLRYNKLNRQRDFASLLIFYERSGNSVQLLLSDFNSKVQTSYVVEFKGHNVILVNEQNAKDAIMSILLYFAY